MAERFDAEAFVRVLMGVNAHAGPEITIAILEAVTPLLSLEEVAALLVVVRARMAEAVKPEEPGHE